MNGKLAFLTVVAVAVIILSTSGLWDGWMNHGSQSTYCLPFCLGGPLPNFVAGDFLMTVEIGATLFLAYLLFMRKGGRTR